MTTEPQAPAAATDPTGGKEPWPALFALCIGFFMIWSTPRSSPSRRRRSSGGRHADVNDVGDQRLPARLAVPVLITGRLGDRFGPKNLYLVGLTVFTLASLWCGLTASIGMLIAARVQGLGASMITPQTMAIITRIFPADRRGAAMALWARRPGSRPGRPDLGGVLVGGSGWGGSSSSTSRSACSGCARVAAGAVPADHTHRFDWLGVALSGTGMFLLVFGIQEGHQYDWSATIWALIISGIAVLALFVGWQARNKGRSRSCRSGCSATATTPWPTSRSRSWALDHLAVDPDRSRSGRRWSAA